MLETLQQRNPKNAYAAQIPPLIFTTYRQLGDNDKAIATAEKILETDQSNEDMLLVVAFNYLQKNQQPDKVQAYSKKLVELMESKPKPEGIADADWTARKTQLAGLGHYMIGSVYMTQSKFAPADETLRLALPLVESNADMKAETLFNLALANFKLGESTKNTQGREERDEERGDEERGDGGGHVGLAARPFRSFVLHSCPSWLHPVPFVVMLIGEEEALL